MRQITRMTTDLCSPSMRQNVTRRHVDFDESREGHALGYDRNGSLVGITIVSPNGLLDEAGPIVITIPSRSRSTQPPSHQPATRRRSPQA